MRRLSDESTRAYKLRQLVVVSVLGAIVLGYEYFTSTPRYSILTVLFLVIGMAAAVAFTIWRSVGYLADEVLEEEAALVARRNGTEARVPFESIVDVRAVTTGSHEGIEIQLRSSVPAFGLRIVFWPPNRRSISGEEMDAIASTLKSRLARARAA